MKALGMLSIVFGHFGVNHEYVYAFHVPLFFCISGFLSKIEKKTDVFLKKMLWNYLFPMFLISFVNYLIGYVIGNNHISFPYFIIGGIIGLHDSLKEMWFVYTLLVLKVILQFNGNQKILILLIPLAFFVAYVLNAYDLLVMGKHILKIHSGLLTVFLAYPFYIMGFLLKIKKEVLSKNSTLVDFLLACFCVPIVYLCGKYNGCAFMVNHEFGDSLLLFTLGSVAGVVLVYAIAQMLSKFKYNGIIDISNGTILILGFQLLFIGLIYNIYKLNNIFFVVLASVLIMMVFIPIIRIVEKYCPILMGKYRIK